MRSLVLEIQREIKTFLKSPFLRLLVVCANPENSVLLLKSLDAVEDDPTMPDILLTFGQSFDEPVSYVKQVIASLREQHNRTSAAFVERGEAALPTLPAELEDASLASDMRAIQALRYVRSIVPPDRRVVWVFYPPEIKLPEEYAHLIECLVEESKDNQLRGVKLIARESEAYHLMKCFNDHPEVRPYYPELDTDSVFKKLTSQANDPHLPPQEQAQIHMMLAGKDMADGFRMIPVGKDAAEQKFAQALARNQELLGYFRHTEQRNLQSVVQNNIGDIHYLMRDYSKAQTAYEQAVQVAVQEKSQPLVLYQSVNLGNALLKQGKTDEALVYFRSAERLAQHNRAIPYQVQALEGIGSTQNKAGQPEQAINTWERAVALCHTSKYEIGALPILEQLRDAWLKRQQLERALACCQSSEQIAQEQGMFQYRIQKLAEIGSLERQLGRRPEAAKTLEMAIALCREHKQYLGTSHIAEELRDLHAEMQNEELSQKAEEARIEFKAQEQKELDDLKASQE